jgi:uncharacterized protein YjbJ (UPF0337 family)
MKYTLKLENSWNEVKEQLQEIRPDLTDEDLNYEEGKEQQLLERLSEKMNMDVEQVKGWIESVSYNKGLAY